MLFNYAQRTLGFKDPAPENLPLKTRTLEGTHFTVSMPDLAGGVSQFDSDRRFRSYILEIGATDLLYSIRPVDQHEGRVYFTGVMVVRRRNSALFTNPDTELIHRVVERVTWLSLGRQFVMNDALYLALPDPLRALIGPLASNLSYEEIAEQLGLSRLTVEKDYAPRVYAAYGVSKREHFITAIAAYSANRLLKTIGMRRMGLIAHYAIGDLPV